MYSHGKALLRRRFPFIIAELVSCSLPTLRVRMPLFQVLLMSADEGLEGCMVQVRWWYEEFMPRLCAACSVTADSRTFKGGADLSHEDVGEWFDAAMQRKEFSPYGHDVAMRFVADRKSVV